MKENFKRREFLTKSFHLTTGVATTFWLASCGGAKTEEKEASKDEAPKDPCNDFSKVSENDLNARKKLGYVNQSPIPESKCGNCQLWLPPKKGVECGNCQLFKGPVMTTGYCTYWAPQVAG
ncbi:high-potential iron-sulfur protein [Dyadobacter luticola]|uniref:High-potential iron-sulfur protein n=1 Tax=Dyadobacter luticola TaxID=1979387 RepID=A0A5R9KX43_9BACT|nr:high-potential iron-sulfur protein [Dyadobacter luticola]TLV00679.1 high-potential iron-sulfur protein [Dyadobacter luticola]